MQIEYSKKAIKYINSADKPTKKRLKESIEKIPLGDIKKLQGIEDGYRLRVGDLRVLFSMEDNIIYIDNIIPRGQAYKRYRRYRMSREMLKNLIELVPENDIDVLYKVIIKFIPEVEPDQDEIEAIKEGRKDRMENGTISHDAINWD